MLRQESVLCVNFDEINCLLKKKKKTYCSQISVWGQKCWFTVYLMYNHPHAKYIRTVTGLKNKVCIDQELGEDIISVQSALVNMELFLVYVFYLTFISIVLIYNINF